MVEMSVHNAPGYVHIGREPRSDGILGAVHDVHNRVHKPQSQPWARRGPAT
jgi:hypothetical protein